MKETVPTWTWETSRTVAGLNKVNKLKKLQWIQIENLYICYCTDLLYQKKELEHLQYINWSCSDNKTRYVNPFAIGKMVTSSLNISANQCWNLWKIYGAQEPSRNRVMYRTSRVRIFQLLRSPRIDSKEPIPPGCVSWRAGTTTSTGYIDWRNWFLGINSWGSLKV